MQPLTSAQFFALAGVGRATFKASVSRGEVALAFGTERALAGGTFLDLDAVAWLLVDELTPAFTRKFAAVIIRAFSDQWCQAVAKADYTSEPVFLMVIEVGEPLGGKLRARREGINVAAGVLADFAGVSLSGGQMIPDRMTFVNVTSVLRRVRQTAATIGVDLTQPFCPSLDDPSFQQAVLATKKVREKQIERVRPSHGMAS